ncbi:hypothetical protein [Flagellimonas meishanensis]|uniref:hypothetical protein n=1 Tax=Flagellimonas meishanensis TaxID=2873264 RepID=UPI001CA6C91F|nr:hypothetical protein [[Muricauda] meishanensis]
MRILRDYWWLLLTLAVITLLFIIRFEWFEVALTFVDDPYVAIGKVVLKLVIVGALLDQLIAVFFPEKKETQEERVRAESALTISREKRRILRDEILKERMANGQNYVNVDLFDDDPRLLPYENSIVDATNAINKMNAERVGFIRVVAFTISLVLAASGITVIREFLVGANPEDFNVKLIFYLDIILTAALISGGTSGINQFFKVIKDSWKDNGVKP